MSFDVFLQGFRDGEVAGVEADVVTRLIGPLIEESTAGFVRIRTGDGGADVYGYDDPTTGLMVNHVSGLEVWDLLVRIADCAGLTVMPVGTRVCVASESMIDHLPAALRRDIAIVQSGADLLAVITG